MISINQNSYPSWETFYYYNEMELPKGIDKTADSWPLYFFEKGNCCEICHCNKHLDFNIKNPNLINFDLELDEVLLSYYFPMEAEKLKILAKDASISRLY